MTKIPANAEIQNWRLALRPSAAPASVKQGSMLLALLHDAFRVKEDELAQVRASATIYVLEDREDGSLPSGFVLASAVDEALRTLIFAPAPSEMLELCRKANSKLSNAISTAERLHEIRHDAALIADAARGKRSRFPTCGRTGRGCGGRSCPPNLGMSLMTRGCDDGAGSPGSGSTKHSRRPSLKLIRRGPL